MPEKPLTDSPVWKQLKKQADAMNRPENHLKHLIKETGRLEKFSRSSAGLLYDYSRQRIDEKTMALLFELAEERKLKQQFVGMMQGEKINTTENRAALHTASRDFSGNPVFVDGFDVMPEIRKVRDSIRDFVSMVHEGKITGSTGKRFQHIVVIGIGGSYLGTEFVSSALRLLADKNIDIHYLSNVDIHDFGRITSCIDPEATLWIVISKSYTTAETMANANLAYGFMKEMGLDPAKHVITVTSKGSPGDDPSQPVLSSFHMFDFIGGRYSVTSAVGGVPLGLYLGYDIFERFLKGAEAMDNHAKSSSDQLNLPMIAALVSIWNNNFLHYPAHAVIPYASPLEKLAPHVQQLYMESNGKSVSREGDLLKEATGVIIFGEPGTNAQHSFFQLAHQGRPFPIDFIGVITPQYERLKTRSRGVTNHQELWANLLSQPLALAVGKEDRNPARTFSGNRPSSTILLKDLLPESVGKLLAFYEAKTIYEAFVWGINPFDQFGVELGKTMASDLRNEMAARNTDSRHGFDDVDPIPKFYLDTLFSV